jgi:hypothetical protein
MTPHALKLAGLECAFLCGIYMDPRLYLVVRGQKRVVFLEWLSFGREKS